MPIVTELMDVRDLEPVLEVADVIQVGARNMQNYTLLTELGRAGRPVLLKRGLSSTLEELLNASEYILKEGNEAVMLCERGIRTFETAYRFTLDLMAVPVLKELTHLPIIIDPSHAAGRRDLVDAAVARRRRGRRRRDHRRGAPEPDEAICDGPQQLAPPTSPPTPRRSRRRPRVAGKEISAPPSRGASAARAHRGRRRGPDRRLGRAGGARAPRRRGERLGPRRGDARARARARRDRPRRHDARRRGRRRGGASSSPRPVGVLPDVVADVLAAAPEDCVVTDVGSTKRSVVDGGATIRASSAATRSPAPRRPACEHARADLFQDATWYLTPTRGDHGAAVRAPAPR